LFMVPLCLVPALALLFFYVSTFQSMCAVPNMAVSCSSLTSWFPGMSLTYFLNDLEMVPVAPLLLLLLLLLLLCGKILAHAHCMLDNLGYTHPPTHAHTTHTIHKTHTNPHYVILIAFPLQQWVRERAAMLRYTHTVCLVQCYIKQVKQRKSEQ